MEASRAKEILEAEETYAVNLEGDSVWIENVDVASGTATVTVGQDPASAQTVDCGRLEEVK
jgi:small acid-soluble spore protein H (minor)